MRYSAKLCLVGSRSVNSLVWALLFVAVFGPGALAGTVAITARGPVEAMVAVGLPLHRPPALGH